MSMVMQDAIDWNGVATMDWVCGVLKITPPPVREWVERLDFDPDAVLAQVDRIHAAHDQIKSTESAFQGTKTDVTVWSGLAAEAMNANVACQMGFWDTLADFLLWLAENVLQLIDYIVDLLRIVVAWITFLVTAFTVIAAVVIMAIAVTAGGGLGAIFGALVDSGVLAVAGAIAVLGIIVSLLLAGLNWCIEWLQAVIRNQRKSICGDPVPALPDWDPKGWEPPAWPI